MNYIESRRKTISLKTRRNKLKTLGITIAKGTEWFINKNRKFVSRQLGYWVIKDISNGKFLATAKTKEAAILKAERLTFNK